jgi:hypothetical protein
MKNSYRNKSDMFLTFMTIIIGPSCGHFSKFSLSKLDPDKNFVIKLELFSKKNNKNKHVRILVMLAK